MYLSNYQSVEPLYIVIVRMPDAEILLREWARTVKSRVEVDKDRARLYDHRALENFYLNWLHNWEQVIIWDCWTKHHIKL